MIFSRTSPGPNDAPVETAVEEDLKRDQVEKSCIICGHLFVTERASIMGREWTLSDKCDACFATLAKAVEEKDSKLQSELRARRFEELCPSLYRSPELRAAAPLDKMKLVREAVASGKGIFAYGESGMFKTTCVWLGAVQWLVHKGKRVECVSGSEIRTRSAEARNKLDAYLAPLIAAPWLFIDDLGQGAMTDAYSDVLLQIAEGRMSESRPVIITTQFDREALAARFTTPETGKAVVRRLSLLANPIQF